MQDDAGEAQGGGQAQGGRAPDRLDLAEAVHISPTGVDGYSDVRFLHARAFRSALGDAPFADAETFRLHVYSSAYIDQLAKSDLLEARFDGQLMGTAAWCPTDDDAQLARVWAVYVAPEFVRQGIGRRLVQEVETRAFAAGFQTFAVRAKGPAVAFFERLGFCVLSQGAAHALMPGGAGPTTYLRKSLPTVHHAGKARIEGPVGGHA